MDGCASAVEERLELLTEVQNGFMPACAGSWFHDRHERLSARSVDVLAYARLFGGK